MRVSDVIARLDNMSCSNASVPVGVAASLNAVVSDHIRRLRDEGFTVVIIGADPDYATACIALTLLLLFLIFAAVLRPPQLTRHRALESPFETSQAEWPTRDDMTARRPPLRRSFSDPT